MNKQQSVRDKIEPVHKELVVSLPQETAFRLFTDGINRWWPLLTHSVGEERAVTCYFESRVGGRIYEVMEDGNQAEWGKVLVWEPFTRVVFSWYPGRTPESYQEVSVTFRATTHGTLLELVHSGWETLGDQAQLIREGYVTGWDYVLGQYTGVAESE